MKKNRLFLPSVLIISLTTLPFAEKVFAEEVNTKSTVKFGPDETSTGPVDPEDGNPTTPEGGGGPSVGSLRMERVSDIDFGEVALSVTQGKAYKAKYQRTTTNGVVKNVPSWITFTDGRGTAEGYEITAKATEFKTTTNDVLTGAQISFKDLQVSYPTGSKEEPTVADTSVNPIVLGTNAQTLVSAPAGKGTGQWNVTIGKEKSDTIPQEADTTARNPAIELGVPKEARKVADSMYSSTITWTIGSTPTSGN